MWEVGLGTNDDAGNLVHATEVDDLVVDDLNHVKGLSGGDGIYENITMNTDGMFGIEDRKFVL